MRRAKCEEKKKKAIKYGSRVRWLYILKIKNKIARDRIIKNRSSRNDIFICRSWIINVEMKIRKSKHH